MKLTNWHISSLTIFALVTGVFIFATSIIGGLLFLSLFPASIWWGWTLHERHLAMEARREQKVLEKYRSEKTRA